MVTLILSYTSIDNWRQHRLQHQKPFEPKFWSREWLNHERNSSCLLPPSPWSIIQYSTSPSTLSLTKWTFQDGRLNHLLLLILFCAWTNYMYARCAPLARFSLDLCWEKEVKSDKFTASVVVGSWTGLCLEACYADRMGSGGRWTILETD